MTDVNPEQTRRDIFRALVTIQDEGLSVSDSREEIAKRFQIDMDTVVGIEREGIDNQWEPL